MQSLFKNTSVLNLLEKAVKIQHNEVWKTVFTDDEFDKFILDLIRIKQLFDEGIDETGNVIGYYSYMTELLSGGEKIEGTPYTLNDTGEFYKSMNLDVQSDFFTIDADPLKRDSGGNETNLFTKYGEGIIGLTDENKEILAEEVKERFRNELKRLLQ